MRSWAKLVEKTSGAPSMGSTTVGWSRQATWMGSAERRGGGDGFLHGGQADDEHGLRVVKEGGVLRRRLSDSPWGNAMAGMYWYWAVCSEPMMRTRSMMAPT